MCDQLSIPCGQHRLIKEGQMGISFYDLLLCSTPITADLTGSPSSRTPNNAYFLDPYPSRSGHTTYVRPLELHRGPIVTLVIGYIVTLYSFSACDGLSL